MLGMPCSIDTFLRASILDKLSLLVWLQTDDAQKGRNRPKMVAQLLMGSGSTEKKSDVVSFASGRDFEEARKELMRQINGD